MLSVHGAFDVLRGPRMSPVHISNHSSPRPETVMKQRSQAKRALFFNHKGQAGAHGLGVRAS